MFQLQSYRSARIFLVAGFLLGILNVNLVAWISYSIEHAMLRERFEKQLMHDLAPEDVTILTFSEQTYAQINRPEDGEIIFEGKRYDVISEVRIQTGFEITGICDDEEVEIEKKAENLLKGKNKRPGKTESMASIHLFPPEFSGVYLMSEEKWVNESFYGTFDSELFPGANFVPPDGSACIA